MRRKVMAGKELADAKSTIFQQTGVDYIRVVCCPWMCTLTLGQLQEADGEMMWMLRDLYEISKRASRSCTFGFVLAGAAAFQKQERRAVKHAF